MQLKFTFQYMCFYQIAEGQGKVTENNDWDESLFKKCLLIWYFSDHIQNGMHSLFDHLKLQCLKKMNFLPWIKEIETCHNAELTAEFFLEKGLRDFFFSISSGPPPRSLMVVPECTVTEEMIVPSCGWMQCVTVFYGSLHPDRMRFPMQSDHTNPSKPNG